MISSLMASLGSNPKNEDINEDLIRHFVLNSIRSIRAKFHQEYGELVIACDDHKNWRRDIFPYYKANRKKERDKSKLDWNLIFEPLYQIKSELKEFFPYRVVQAEKAEADDIIAVLVEKYGNTNEKILIISGDKDYRQLHSYINVRQYDPVHKKGFINESDPERYLKEHIMRGDQGDGVPNFLSEDASFVLGIRQKSLYQKKINEWVNLEPEEFCDELMLKRYYRNKTLVDLSEVPSHIKNNILEEYEREAGKNRTKLFGYFIEHKLKYLMTDIHQF